MVSAGTVDNSTCIVRILICSIAYCNSTWSVPAELAVVPLELP